MYEVFYFGVVGAFANDYYSQLKLVILVPQEPVLGKILR